MCAHTHVGTHTYMHVYMHTHNICLYTICEVSCTYKTWYLFAPEKNVKFAFLHLLILLNMVSSCTLSSNNKHTFVLPYGRQNPIVYRPHVPD